MNNLKSLEELYIKWKNAYYEGNPLVPDADFDALEEKLKDLGSKIINLVGSLDNPKAKFRHPTRMLSLAKIKTNDNKKPPIEDFLKWIKKVGNCLLECTPKYDGNAVNIVYDNGKLRHILTRGSGGLFGQDITSKLENQVPKNILTDKKIIEIRGEVVIEVKTFENKYKYLDGAEKKNARNFVAGILNRNEVNKETLKDLRFIPFEIKEYDGIDYSYILDIKTKLTEYGFKYLPYIRKTKDLTAENFIKIFNHFLNFRKNESIYQLDGFVLKVLDTNKRIELGENDHDPEWALAVKFEPKEISTHILDIEWKLGKTGEFAPVAILEPVDLDGSTVSRASLYNYGYIVDRGLTPGAKVSLVKSGDIIPQILNVLEPSTELIDNYLITECPHCGSKLKIDGLHLLCVNLNCKGKDLERFKSGINKLKLDFFGGKSIEKIYFAGLTNPFDIFDKNKFNIYFLNMAGWGDGISAQKLLHQVEKIKDLSLKTIILAMAIPNLGDSLAEEISKMVSGQKYTTYGLQKEFFELFKPGNAIREYLDEILSNLKSFGINIILPEQLAPGAKLYECTGSPKPLFSTKEEFEKFMKTNNFIHKSLSKETEYLITDSYNSSSGKMKTAQKLNVKIITYSDIFKILNKK